MLTTLTNGHPLNTKLTLPAPSNFEPSAFPEWLKSAQSHLEDQDYAIGPGSYRMVVSVPLPLRTGVSRMQLFAVWASEALIQDGLLGRDQQVDELWVFAPDTYSDASQISVSIWNTGYER